MLEEQRVLLSSARITASVVDVFYTELMFPIYQPWRLCILNKTSLQTPFRDDKTHNTEREAGELAIERNVSMFLQ